MGTAAGVLTLGMSMGLAAVAGVWVLLECLRSLSLDAPAVIDACRRAAQHHAAWRARTDHNTARPWRRRAIKLTAWTATFMAGAATWEAVEFCAHHAGLEWPWGLVEAAGKPEADVKAMLSSWPAYPFLEPYSEGLAALKVGKQFGYVDENFNVAIPCRYDAARPFTEGLAAVCVSHRWGYIDKTGAEVIPVQFALASPFENGRAVVIADSIDDMHYIDRQGRPLGKL